MPENSYIHEYLIKTCLAIRFAYLLYVPFNFIKNIIYILQIFQYQNPTFFAVILIHKRLLGNKSRCSWTISIELSGENPHASILSSLVYISPLYNYGIKISNVFDGYLYGRHCSKSLTYIRRSDNSVCELAN